MTAPSDPEPFTAPQSAVTAAPNQTIDTNGRQLADRRIGGGKPIML
jgi:hypothetical protein